MTIIIQNDKNTVFDMFAREMMKIAVRIEIRVPWIHADIMFT